MTNFDRLCEWMEWHKLNATTWRSTVETDPYGSDYMAYIGITSNTLTEAGAVAVLERLRQDYWELWLVDLLLHRIKFDIPVPVTELILDAALAAKPWEKDDE